MIIVLSVVVVAAFIVGCTTCCSSSSEKSAPASAQNVAYYTCPMHPSVKSDSPGTCHICGMELVPVYTNAPAAKP